MNFKPKTDRFDLFLACQNGFVNLVIRYPWPNLIFQAANSCDCVLWLKQCSNPASPFLFPFLQFWLNASAKFRCNQNDRGWLSGNQNHDRICRCHWCLVDYQVAEHHSSHWSTIQWPIHLASENYQAVHIDINHLRLTSARLVYFERSFLGLHILCKMNVLYALCGLWQCVPRCFYFAAALKSTWGHVVIELQRKCIGGERSILHLLPPPIQNACPICMPRWWAFHSHLVHNEFKFPDFRDATLQCWFKVTARRGRTLQIARLVGSRSSTRPKGCLKSYALQQFLAVTFLSLLQETLSYL
jgi:hypothetical protein